jgi:hypothetical protein
MRTFKQERWTRHFDGYMHFLKGKVRFLRRKVTPSHACADSGSKTNRLSSQFSTTYFLPKKNAKNVRAKKEMRSP